MTTTKKQVVLQEHLWQCWPLLLPAARVRRGCCVYFAGVHPNVSNTKELNDRAAVNRCIYISGSVCVTWMEECTGLPCDTDGQIFVSMKCKVVKKIQHELDLLCQTVQHHTSSTSDD